MKIFESRIYSLNLLFAVSLGFASSLQAQQPSDASFLLTSKGDALALDVLVENPEVTVFDLMIPVGALDNAQAALDKCTSGVFGSHVGGCNIAEGEFRMVVFSPQNAALPSGNIGKFQLPGVEFDASDVRIRAYDSKGHELAVEVLTDTVGSERKGKDRITPLPRGSSSTDEIK